MAKSRKYREISRSTLATMLLVTLAASLLGQQSDQQQSSAAQAQIDADNLAIQRLQEAFDALNKSHPDMASQSALTVGLFFSEVVKTLGDAFVSTVGERAGVEGKLTEQMYNAAQSFVDMYSNGPKLSDQASLGASSAGVGGWELREKQLKALSDGAAAVEQALEQAKNKPDNQNFVSAAGSLVKFIGDAAALVAESNKQWADRLGKVGTFTGVAGDLSRSVQDFNGRQKQDQELDQSAKSMIETIKQQMAGRFADIQRLQPRATTPYSPTDDLPKIAVKSIGSLFTYEAPTVSGAIASHDAALMSDMVSDSHRLVIAGTGPTAQQLYDLMSKRLGSENTKWIKTYAGPSDLQAQASDFRADMILGVHNQLQSTTFPKPDPPRSSSDVKPPPQMFPNPPICPPSIPGCGGGAAGGGNDPRRPPPPPPSVTRNVPPPPPAPPSLGLGTGGVGGVMLSGSATVKDVGGGPLSLGNGEFSILFNDPEAGIDFNQYRRFVTAMWAVYFEKDGPGISIDPVGPGAEQQQVRYIGNVLRSDLGRVMRDADYQMKKWAVGSEHPEIPGFQSVDRLTKANGLRYLGAARRFWFVPEAMQFRQAGDALLFDSGRMTVKTEYVTLNKGVPAEPADEAFAKAFTDRYGEIAAKYPVYQELFDYAKLVSLARYVKEKNVPLLWFLLANKDLAITEKAPPETVKALIKQSEVFDYVTIEGGVDLARHAGQERYIVDNRTTFPHVINESGAPAGRNTSLATDTPALFSTSERSFGSHPSSELVVGGGTSGGKRYQTDLALRNQGEPGLELVRDYNPAIRSAEFGPGWRVIQPYRVEPASDVKIPFVNALVPEKMRVENLITGKVEVLTFNGTRYNVESYVPDDPDNSSLLFLAWMSNGTVRLVDKLGNEFQFDGLGRTTQLIISSDYRMDYVYDTERAGVNAFDRVPYQLKVSGADREEIAGGRVSVPARFVLLDSRDGSEAVFMIDKRPSRRKEGWLPQPGATGKYKFMALMTDGSFDVEDQDGNEIEFDAGGKFTGVVVPVLRGLRQGDQRIDFDYEYRAGQFRIRQGKVMKDGLTASLYSIRYDYDRSGRLSSVTGPEGTVSDIRYEGAGVYITARK